MSKVADPLLYACLPTSAELLGVSPEQHALWEDIKRTLSPAPTLTVTTGYLIRQVYSDGSVWDHGREPAKAKARAKAAWLTSYFGNVFKIVRLYRKVRSK